MSTATLSLFGRLPFRTRRTVRHHHDERGEFLRFVRQVQRVIPARFPFVLYEGSGSWLGSEDDRTKYLQRADDDLTLLKLCFHGVDVPFTFGVRERFAVHFANLVGLSCWDRRFHVLPHVRDDAIFVGFPARNDVRSLQLVQKVIKAIEDEVAGTVYS